MGQFPGRLEGAGVVVSRQPFPDDGNGDGAGGVETMPNEGPARAEGEIAPLRAAIKAEMVVEADEKRSFTSKLDWL